MSAGTCPPDPCKGLLQEILDFMANLQKREADLLANEGDLPLTKPSVPDPRYGTRSIQGEQHQFEGRQQGLRNRLQKYQDDGCGDPPPRALDYATKPVPAPQPKSAPAVDMKKVDVGVGVGFGVAAGYVAYRIIRMIPSVVIPPLWWTIPENAVIP